MKTICNLKFFATTIILIALINSNIYTLKQDLSHDKELTNIIDTKFTPEEFAEFYQYFRWALPKEIRKEIPPLNFFKQHIKSRIYTILERYKQKFFTDNNQSLIMLKKNVFFFFQVFNQDFYKENLELFLDKINTFIDVLTRNNSNAKNIMNKTVLFIKDTLYEVFTPDLKERNDLIEQEKKYEKKQRTQIYFNNLTIQNKIYENQETDMNMTPESPKNLQNRQI
ncbi:MAG: hypothetical protein ABH827_01855 [bacterium]